jgi:hypothetical protein
VNHTLLVMGALSLFLLGQVGLNSIQQQARQSVLESDMTLTGMALAQDYIERGQGMLYDEILHQGAPASVTQFTSSMALGPETGETFYTYDDVDDFNGLSRTEVTDLGTFRIRATVAYVTATEPDTPTAQQTYYKRMWVRVDTPTATDAVNTGFLFCYF